MTARPRWTPAALLILAGSCHAFGASLFPASIDLSSLNGTDGFVLNGIDAGDHSGQPVSSAGDVNGDGIDDLIIGAPDADPNGQNGAGESYVVFGFAGLGAGGSLDLSSLNGATGFVINGVAANDNSGFSVSSAGDVNGDGVDDLIIGAVGASPNGQYYAGESCVVFGGPGVGAGGSLDLSTLNGTNGFELNGVNGSLGVSVSAAGDVNGDGVDDVIIGAWKASPNGQTKAGASYVVFGGAGVGVGGSLDLSSLSGANGFVLNGIAASDYSGRSVSSVGDVNGDGVDDLITGAPLADPNGHSQAGESYVVFGRVGFGACCLSATHCVDVSAALATDCATFGGTFAGANTDCATTTCPGCPGDLNNDGSTDVFDFGIFARDFGCGTGP